MTARDYSTDHRSSTNLELLFDLTFVVAVAQVAHGLAEHLSEGHVWSGVEGYLSVFFAIWWAWVNFTWFASAFDTDDVPYRLLTFLQMSGVLVLAAGVPRAFDGDFDAVTAGYVVMRVAMIGQWLRAAAGDPQFRPTCLRYAAGVGAVQIGWVARLALPHTLGWVSFVILAGAEMAVPYWAERPQMTTWHPAHIAERYSLFTIIVLGEGISQLGVAVQTAYTAGGVTSRLVVTAVGGLILLLGMWWLYFSRESGDALRERLDLAYFWGYGHYLVFAAVAAVAAGIDVAITSLDEPAAATAGTEASGSAHVELSHPSIALAIAAPVAVYLVTLGVMLGRLHGELLPKLPRVVTAAVVTVVAALTAHWLPLPVVGVLMALPTVALAVDEVVRADRRSRTTDD